MYRAQQGAVIQPSLPCVGAAERGQLRTLDHSERRWVAALGPFPCQRWGKEHSTTPGAPRSLRVLGTVLPLPFLPPICSDVLVAVPAAASRLSSQVHLEPPLLALQRKNPALVGCDGGNCHSSWLSFEAMDGGGTPAALSVISKP